MIQLDIYGKNSSTYQSLKQLLSKKLTASEIDIAWREFHDVRDFMEENVTSIPAIRLNNNKLYEYKENDDVEIFVDKVLDAVHNELRVKKQEIIVPIDFSKTSISALKFAAQLANSVDSNVKMIHVFHPQPVQVNGALWINPESTSTFKQMLDKLALSLVEEFPNVEFHTEVVEGFAGEVINALSKKTESKYIVMGNSGEGSSLRSIMGRVSRDVALSAQCPTFVIPPSFNYDIKSMIYACDIDQPDINALEIVNRVATGLKAKLYIVQVSPIDSVANPLEKKELNKALLDYNIIKIKSKTVVEGLFIAAEKVDCDMISLTTIQRSFWDQLAHKSTTKAVYKTLVHRSLLVIHREK